MLIEEDSYTQAGVASDEIDYTEPREECIGRNGLERKDAKRQQLIEFIHSNSLVVLNTLFNNKNHNACNMLNRKCYLHQFDNMTRCRIAIKLVAKCGVESMFKTSSNHNAVSLAMRIKAESKKKPPKSI